MIFRLFPRLQRLEYLAVLFGGDRRFQPEDHLERSRRIATPIIFACEFTAGIVLRRSAASSRRFIL